MIDIIVNGEPKQVKASLSVSELLAKYELPFQTVIVELGGEILAKDAYGETTLKSGDKVELIQFVGGG